MSVEWTDDGIIIATAPYGERNLIAHVFTRHAGRHAGLVSGGQGSKKQADWLVGNLMNLRWQARTEDQLGTFIGEPTAQIASLLFDSPEKLDALQSACALLYRGTAEREHYPDLFQQVLTMFKSLLGRPDWPALYIRFEGELLKSLGYGLDLSTCAITGETTGLTHVSPRTGRAVRGDAAAAYLDRLLPLPSFLIDDNSEVGDEDVADGLRLTGHFLDQHLFAALERPMPFIREQLVSHFVNRTDPTDE